jgi:hypothetical protein
MALQATASVAAALGVAATLDATDDASREAI